MFKRRHVAILTVEDTHRTVVLLPPPSSPLLQILQVVVTAAHHQPSRIGLEATQLPSRSGRDGSPTRRPAARTHARGRRAPPPAGLTLPPFPQIEPKRRQQPPHATAALGARRSAAPREGGQRKEEIRRQSRSVGDGSPRVLPVAGGPLPADGVRRGGGGARGARARRLRPR